MTQSSAPSLSGQPLTCQELTCQPLSFQDQYQLREANIFSCVDDIFLVTDTAGLVKARRAASCLLAPETGDTVLLCAGPASAWIVAVLERRAESQPDSRAADTAADTAAACARIVLPEHCAVQATTLSLTAARDLRLAGQKIQVKGHAVDIAASLVRATGMRLEQGFQAVHTKAEHLVTQAGRVLGFFRRRLEKVDGLCETEAGSMRVSSKESLRVRSQSLDMRSKKTVVLDGEHIHIG